MESLSQLLWVWASVFLTLAIFSFLYKDNPLYKFAEHLFIGVATGYTLVQAVTGTLGPNLYQPLKEAWLSDSASFSEAVHHWKRLGALALGILILCRLHPKAAWISRWPLALLIGTFAALRLTGYAQSDIVQQINGTMVPVAGGGLPWLAWEGPSLFNHWVLVAGVLCVLIYFFFSVEQKGALGWVSYIGTFFLMITFGSSFGYTVLARVSLLIGRVQDLYLYAEGRYGYASIVLALVMIAVRAIWAWRSRKRARQRGKPERTEVDPG
jgi:hypothetical protein